MNTTQETLPAPARKLWQRALLMLLLGLAFQLSATLLLFTAVLQLLLLVFTEQTNPRLTRFGRGLGRYLAQIANFETFNTEELPFPFSDWPSESATSNSAF